MAEIEKDFSLGPEFLLTFLIEKAFFPFLPFLVGSAAAADRLGRLGR